MWENKLEKNCPSNGVMVYESIMRSLFGVSKKGD